MLTPCRLTDLFPNSVRRSPKSPPCSPSRYVLHDRKYKSVELSNQQDLTHPQVLNGVLAYAIILVILFCIQDMEAAVSSAFPIVEICMQVTGSLQATTAMVSGLIIISFAVTLGSIASASRLTWAWARDGGLPAWFAHISPRHRIPVRSIWLPIFIVSAFPSVLAFSHVKFITDRPRTGHVPRVPQHRQLLRLRRLHLARLVVALRIIRHRNRLHAPRPPARKGHTRWLEYGPPGCASQHLRAGLLWLDDGVLLLRKCTCCLANSTVVC